MIEHVLVAYDGSEEAARALEFSLQLAGRLEARVTVARALSEREDEAGGRPGRVEEARGIAPPGVRVEAATVHGQPAAALLDLLEETPDVDLVVCGARGLGGLRRFLLGSTSERLLEHAPCPVLVFRGESTAMAANLKVLAAVDGSDGSRHALAVAAGLAAALSAALVVVHAVDYHMPYVALDPYSGAAELLKAQGKELLKDVRASIAAPLEAVETDLRMGSAREQLIAACRDHQPAIIVLGNRGAGGFMGMLLGGTAREVARSAPCPVLVVRSPGTDSKPAGD